MYLEAAQQLASSIGKEHIADWIKMKQGMKTQESHVNDSRLQCWLANSSSKNSLQPAPRNCNIMLLPHDRYCAHPGNRPAVAIPGKPAAALSIKKKSLTGHVCCNGNPNPVIQLQILCWRSFRWHFGLCNLLRQRDSDKIKILQQLVHTKERNTTHFPVYRSFYCSLKKPLCKNQDNVF